MANNDCYAGTCVYRYDTLMKRFELVIPDGNKCDPAFPAATCTQSIIAHGAIMTAMPQFKGHFPEYRMVVCCRKAASWPASIGS
jgi:hypothetical protein